jgi:hypothetical protein
MSDVIESFVPEPQTVEFVPEGGANVADFHRKVVERNVSMLSQLQLRGTTVPRWLETQAAVETLVDFLFDDSDMRAAFQCAVDVNLGQKLQALLNAPT